MSLENLTWDEEYNIGVPSIDSAHEEFFRIARRVHNMAGSKKNSSFAVQEGLKFLKIYAQKHFEDEESYMASIGYKDLATHKMHHDHLRDRILPRMEAHLVAENYSIEASDKFLKILMMWLTRHIMVHDKAIGWAKASPAAL